MAPHQKAHGRNIHFGVCFLTPRYKNDELSGYQMTCTQPHHNKGKKCAEDTSFGAAGDAGLCRRMLKSWLVFGATIATRDEHRDMWMNILEMRNKNGLPEEQELDAAAVSSWDSYNSV